MEIRHYVSSTGRDPYQSWLDRLQDLRARVAIQRRIDRISLGHFGDHRPCRDGVRELRLDVGPGYRVYYARVGRSIVLLLFGGEKGTQTSGIDTAVRYWMDYQRRLG